MIGHLDDPRTGRTFGAIKHRAFLMDEEKNVLEQVVRFRIVPEDLVPDRPYQAGITAKKATQSLLISIDGASHQGFVGRTGLGSDAISSSSFRSGCRALLVALVSRSRRRRQRLHVLSFSSG